MAADFSRVRLDPLLNYAGVELKQGGVLLDADANELVAILDRRLRALASDTLGRATVSANTPDAFQLGLAGGMLRIGRGRLYVDGLLAENHGAAPAEGAAAAFDALLGEPASAEPVDYAAQPFLPDPPALPTSGRHLVYLDVWDRELTHLAAPALVEPAVGVETSSRRQTVWQVRVLAEAAGAAGCATPDAELPGWAAVIAPSTGRLSTGTYDIAPADDPCELPPSGGYRGLENQLYRVQIHDGGHAGAGATFKWSRENASVGSRVASLVSATRIELASLGRDEVLGIASGDWVEVLDDARELAGRPGELRRVTVDAATRQLSFAPALPADLLPASFPDAAWPAARGLRVQRWDQRGKVLRTGPDGTPVEVQDLDAPGAAGGIAVPGAGVSLILEHGVTVRFDEIGGSGGAGFRSGDYWTFAARTGDASLERLDQAAPRGIHHHFARLGFWDVDAGSITDCRHRWPPEAGGGDCGCTACVSPESHASGQFTIQAAIDRVHDRGGSVCLQAGVYSLAEPLRIAAAKSLRIRGQGPATVLVTAGSAIVVEASSAIAVEELSVLSLGRASAVSVRSAIGLALRALVVVVVPNNDLRGAAVALAGVVAGATIADNLFIGADGIRAGEPGQREAPGFLVTAGLQIDDNVLWCQRSAVLLAGSVAHFMGTRVRGNQVIGARSQAMDFGGLALPGASLRIDGNDFAVPGPGIRCATDGAWIEGNKLHAARQGERLPSGAGVVLATGLDASGSDQCQVLGNQIDGFPDAALLVQAPVADLVVANNLIADCGNGLLMTGGAAAGALTVAHNQLRRIGSERSDSALGAVVAGIGLARCESASITGNTLREVGSAALRGKQLVAGIFGVALQQARIDGNDLAGIGPEAEFGGSVAGIMLRAPYAQVALRHNRVERDARAAAQPSPTAWSALVLDEPDGRERVLSRAAGFAALRVDAARTLVLAGDAAWVDAGRPSVDAAGAQVVRGAEVSVLGNELLGRGRQPVVDISASGELLFSDNRCELRANTSVEAVRLRAPVAIIHGNRVRGGKPSVTVAPDQAVVAAVGNITSGSIAAPLRPEMVPLNPVA